jgi:ApaG protein
MIRMAKPEFTCDVRVQYLPDQSQPPEGPFAFAYTVTIRNTGGITGPAGGAALGGHQRRRPAKTMCAGWPWWGTSPLLKPGEQFEYTSWTRINTPHGTDARHLLLHDRRRAPFEAAVPEFMLVSPGALH